jgi:beta-1,4-galactosyltransferase 1
MLPKRYITFIVICLLTFIQTLHYFILEIKGDTREAILNASFFLQVNFSILDQTAYHALPNCSSLFSANSANISSNHKVEVQQILYTYQELETRHSTTIYLGGHWFPTRCQAEQRLAIIVCYRKREQHLKMFLDNIHPFLQQQQLDYTVIVVNQHEPEQFNRAALFNIGFIEALKLYLFNCFIFHDVDLLPEDSRNIYKCVNQPQHM